MVCISWCFKSRDFTMPAILGGNNLPMVELLQNVPPVWWTLFYLCVWHVCAFYVLYVCVFFLVYTHAQWVNDLDLVNWCDDDVLYGAIIFQSSCTLQSSLLLQILILAKLTVFNSWRKPTTDFNRSLRLAPQCVTVSSMQKSSQTGEDKSFSEPSVSLTCK